MFWKERDTTTVYNSSRWPWYYFGFCWFGGLLRFCKGSVIRRVDLQMIYLSKMDKNLSLPLINNHNLMLNLCIFFSSILTRFTFSSTEYFRFFLFITFEKMRILSLLIHFCLFFCFDWNVQFEPYFNKTFDYTFEIRFKHSKIDKGLFTL